MKLWLGVLALLASQAAAAAAAQDSWRFRVLLDGIEIGHHDFLVQREGEVETVQSSARYRVKLLVFDAFRYAHDSRERWRGGCLEAIAARTDDNGSALEVEGRMSGSALAVEGPSGQYSAPGCVMSFAYWNPAILQRRRLLNAQTGEYQDVSVVRRSEEALVVNGGTVRAQRYDIVTRDFTLNLWYGRDGRWLALASNTGGRLLRYVPR